MRGADGLCIECGRDEVGEADRRHLAGRRARLRGLYQSSRHAKRRSCDDVFEKGDRWFRTGDLMRRDAHGYFYFVDRIGDTFRWKGENVATSEVAEALGVVPGIARSQCLWRGGARQDGRAGMAALVVAPAFRSRRCWPKRCRDNLPAYARPMFLRLKPEIEITGTFKQRKVELVKEGFDPSAIADPLYWYDRGKRPV